MYIHTYIHTYTHTHTYIYTYIYTYIHICIHTESFTKLDSEQRQFSANYTGGEKAGESWTDRVMGFKQQQETREEKGGGEVEEDEWVSRTRGHPSY